MLKTLSFLLIALSLITTCHADVYRVRPDITEQELHGLYVDMLLKFTRLAEGVWHDADPGLGYWGTGRSDWNNEGIRAVSTTALAYALLAKEPGTLDRKAREHYVARAISGIRYAVRTHKTGGLKCTDDKQWGDSWQSTFWTSNLGLAAWIAWDDLDGELREEVERVVSHEADRLLVRTPPGSRMRDTKAEENAWDQMAASLAASMFRDHPNAPAWREKSIEFMMNTLSVPQDLNDGTVVDGKPIKEWVKVLNAHPDYTIENHGFFHPSYTMVSPAMVGQGAFFYARAGSPVPQAAMHHLLDNWRLLQGFMLPHGYWGFVQGMDWALNSDGHIHYLAWLATYARDPIAAGMEKIVAQTIAGHQAVHEDGTFAGPSSRLGFGREAIVAERLSYSYLYHKHIGCPPQPARTIRQAARELNGVRRYPLIDVITHRTNSKFASFSWSNKLMGLAMPIGEGHEANPYFVTPLTSGFVGSFVLEDPAKGIRTLSRTWRKTALGFETEGAADINGGLLRQEIKFASVGEHTVVYTDRVTALEDVKVLQEAGVPFGIENDEFTGNRRTLFYEAGSRTITGPDTEETITIPGRWANVDGRLGVVSALGSGLTYLDVAKYNRDGAREDFLYASYSSEARGHGADDVVARRAVVAYLETSPQRTAELASAVRIENEVLVVPLPEGGEYRMALVR